MHLDRPWWFYNAAWFCGADSPEAWSEVNTLRLAYSAPKARTPHHQPDHQVKTALFVLEQITFKVLLYLQEGQAKYFLFALPSRRKAYSHFYCRSSDLVSLELTSCRPKSHAEPPDPKKHPFILMLFSGDE